MASKKNGSPRHSVVQGFVKEQIDDAQKRLAAFESEAQKVLETIADRAQRSRKDVEGLLQRFNGLEQLRDGLEQLRELNPLDPQSRKAISKKATQARNEVQKKLNQLQTRVVESVGVASQAQVREINREIARLSKKLDSLIGKKPAARAESR